MLRFIPSGKVYPYCTQLIWWITIYNTKGKPWIKLGQRAVIRLICARRDRRVNFGAGASSGLVDPGGRRVVGDGGGQHAVDGVAGRRGRPVSNQRGGTAFGSEGKQRRIDAT